MSASTPVANRPPFQKWLLEGHVAHSEGPHESEGRHHAHPWWQVMCLTGVDYFSTLGYQPGIAAVAAGALSPIATLFLVLLTLFGALPIYARVAHDSPRGEGSIAMLEHLLPWWQGKFFVLALLGFVATDFIITITLSAADATAHLVENPFVRGWLVGPATAVPVTGGNTLNVVITLAFVACLGAVFLKGFKEAVGLAVGLVAIYLGLNLVVVGVALYQVAIHPAHFPAWLAALGTSHSSPLAMVGYAMLLFPKLALGLSGFETGVAVMPLVQGDAGDDAQQPLGRIRNTRKLLTTAAVIMSVFLIASSFVTTLLIPHDLFMPGGEANGRALAFLAHRYLGNGFGTVYDISTILILWFAGASAMAGLLNIVPRYLPRYGMAPDWTRAVRPLVLVFVGIAFIVTLMFHADVDLQGGAYATGVLVLMSSAAVAVSMSARVKKQGKGWAYGLIAVIFIYTTVVNVIERPEGIKIASCFIAAIMAFSALSRIMRSTELRISKVALDESAQLFVDEMGARGVRIIANKRQVGDPTEYALKEDRQREDSHIPGAYAILFVEIDVRDASEFGGVLHVRGVDIGGYRVLRADAPSVPNAIAALLLHLRDSSGRRPHAYFDWSEGNPLVFMMRYLLFGQGDTAPVTREVLRQAEPDPMLRPMIHVDG